MIKFSLDVQLVDIHQDSIYPATVQVQDGKIASISRMESGAEGLPFLLPPFVDAHVHVESSMLIPTEFARMAVVHGTVGSVSDPHEIANVLGLEGVRYMIENGRQSPFKFNFGAPPCVPATQFETAGATLGPDEIETLLKMPEVGYLAEVMNFPGVLGGDPDMLAKIALAKKYNKPIDGHAPGLRGVEAERYAAAGISTDHECFTLAEAQDKLAVGMKILIREGSAAKNFEALYPLLRTHPDRVMFCSDDKHPNDLVHGHINQLVARAVAKGINLFDALRAASLNTIQHYDMPVGLLREGDPADFVTVQSLEDFRVSETWINGEMVFRAGENLLPTVPAQQPNLFNCKSIRSADLVVPQKGSKLRCIIADDGQIVTRSGEFELPTTAAENVVSDIERDLLKLAVVNRYVEAPPALAFVHGFGLHQGALASTVAHDSHNIIAVGTSDDLLAEAIELVRKAKGGIAFAGAENPMVLPLPVAGLMTTTDGWQVAKAYEEIDAAAKKQGCTLSAPYMTLSFLALLVIPALKLSDKGLFDGNKFSFAELFSD